jgi:hypothetical protein
MQVFLCKLQGVRLASQIDRILDCTNFLLQLENTFNGFLILTIRKN